MNGSGLVKKMIPILLASFPAWFYTMAYTPLGYLFNDFPGQDALIMLVVSLPGIMAMVAAFSSSGLMLIMNKKTLVIISLVVMFIGGMLVRFFGAGNLMVTIIGSTMTGFGAGSIPAANLAILAEISPEKLRDKVCGWSDSLCMVGITIAVLVGGFLAADGVWVRAFNIYYIVLPIIVAVIIWYPSNKTAAAIAEKVGATSVNQANETGVEAVTNSMPKSVYGLIVVKFISAFFYMGAAFFLSDFIINEAQVGTSALVGTVNSAGALIATLGSAFVFLWLKGFKSFSTVVSLIIMGTGMILMVAFPSPITLVLFGGILLNIGMNTHHSSASTVATMAPKGKIVAVATSLFVGATFVGEAMPGYVLPWISNMVFGSASSSQNLIVGGVGCIIMGLVSYIFYRKAYKIAFPKQDKVARQTQ
jgi:MFS family permease